MRPELLTPAADLTAITDEEAAGILIDVLGLVGVHVTPEQVASWVPLERALAYDWAMRVHLRASDNQVRERPKPSFVTAAEAS